jgi:hypothetical protein
VQAKSKNFTTKNTKNTKEHEGNRGLIFCST